MFYQSQRAQDVVLHRTRELETEKTGAPPQASAKVQMVIRRCFGEGSVRCEGVLGKNIQDHLNRMYQNDSLPRNKIDIKLPLGAKIP